MGLFDSYNEDGIINLDTFMEENGIKDARMIYSEPLFTYDDKKYFANLNYENYRNEIVAYEIAGIMRIHAAKYRYASYKNNQILLSDCPVSFVRATELFGEYVKQLNDRDTGIDSFNNIKQARNVFEWHVGKSNQGNNENPLIQKFIDVFTYDLIIKNDDRSHYNWGVFDNDGTADIHVYDSIDSSLNQPTLFFSDKTLLTFPMGINYSWDDKTLKESLKNLVEEIDITYLNSFYYWLTFFFNFNFQSFFAYMEIKYMFSMPTDYRKEVEQRLKHNIYEILTYISSELKKRKDFEQRIIL